MSVSLPFFLWIRKKNFTCTHTHTYIYPHTHNHTHTQSHTHTHAHTHAHTHTRLYFVYRRSDLWSIRFDSLSLLDSYSVLQKLASCSLIYYLHFWLYACYTESMYVWCKFQQLSSIILLLPIIFLYVIMDYSVCYRVATVSRIDQIIGLFCRI